MVTRRFFCRPASVALLAIGSASPWPKAVIVDVVAAEGRRRYCADRLGALAGQLEPVRRRAEVVGVAVDRRWCP